MTESERKPARTRSATPVRPRRTILSHVTIDRRNAEQDRLVANRLQHDHRVLRQARTNLRRWMARDGKRVRPVFAEWWRVLERLTADEIADFLLSDTPLARRLRQSSPFAGLVSEAGRRAPRNKHETARA